MMAGGGGGGQVCKASNERGWGLFTQVRRRVPAGLCTQVRRAPHTCAGRGARAGAAVQGCTAMEAAQAAAYLPQAPRCGGGVLLARGVCARVGPQPGDGEAVLRVWGRAT